jgi:aryl-alcohol dehydrogenase-like predicted oxidoreductase
MNDNRLGKGGIWVSDTCMGIMTFGAPPMRKPLAKLLELVGHWLKTKSHDSGCIATKVSCTGHGKALYQSQIDYVDRAFMDIAAEIGIAVTPLCQHICRVNF